MSSARTDERRKELQATYEAQEAKRQQEIAESAVSNNNIEYVNKGTADGSDRRQSLQATYEAQEAQRQQRIAEYRAFNNNIAKANKEFASYCQELQEIEGVVKTNLTGEKANELIQNIAVCRNKCENVVEELNNEGKKVAEKINAEGQLYTFEGTYVSTSSGKSNSYNQTFSCNTDLLKNVLSRLEKVYGKITVTTSTLAAVNVPEGCGSINGTIDSMQNTNTQITNIYSQTLAFINEVEAMEKENMELVGTLDKQYSDTKQFTVIGGNLSGKTYDMSKQTQSNVASTFGQNITYTEQSIMGARVLVPSTANDGTTKKVTVMLPGEGANSELQSYSWIVKEAMQRGTQRYNGYTAIMREGSNSTTVINFLEELSKQYDIDLENVELVGFSAGANSAFGVVSGINKSDNGVHVSSLDYIGGNIDEPAARKEVINDDSVKVTAYYGTGDAQAIHRNIQKNLKGAEGVDVYELNAGHAIWVGGIVDVFFSTYAHNKQNLKK